MQEKLETAEERLQRQAHELETHIVEARTDALTGLSNRRAFDSEMQRLEKEFHQHARTSSVMMVDVDHFKQFNDTHGHQAGDEVLRGVARVLRENLPNDAVVCRYGGEEFAILFPGQDLSQARTTAVSLRVTASGGVAEFMPAETVEEMVKRSDEALYACKSAGRNCGYWHDGQRCHSMTSRVQETTETTSDSTATPAMRDSVTGLASRHAFLDDMQRRMAEWRRGGAALTVMLVEIDRFDRLTKAFGLSAGDTMLKATAQFLKATMRDMDHVARWDHRQFSLLLPCASIDDAKIVGERLRSAIENCKLPVQGGVLQFTISVGATEVVKEDDVEGIMRRARSAVREASQLGGNRAAVWNESDMASSGAAENTP
jgi:diguanylate cyclase